MLERYIWQSVQWKKKKKRVYWIFFSFLLSLFSCFQIMKRIFCICFSFMSNFPLGAFQWLFSIWYQD